MGDMPATVTAMTDANAIRDKMARDNRRMSETLVEFYEHQLTTLEPGTDEYEAVEIKRAGAEAIDMSVEAALTGDKTAQNLSSLMLTMATSSPAVSSSIIHAALMIIVKVEKNLANARNTVGNMSDDELENLQGLHDRACEAHG